MIVRRVTDEASAARDALALLLSPGVGPATVLQRLQEHGDLSRALEATLPVEMVARTRERAVAIIEDAAAVGITATSCDDAGYPESLRDLGDAPPVLWSVGDPAVLEAPRVAIVGTRRVTSYGAKVARELAGALARAGACVVSGMALGVDGIAHEAALDAEGRTVAVLGTGVDVPYPPAHRALHRRIAERGLILSEERPGSSANRGSFPRRNRIIAALARLTIIVEAPLRSGALITADCAMELDRVVAAVPGPIDSPQSEGTNLLIRDGAQIVTSVADALALAGLTPALRNAATIADESQARVYAALGDGPLDVDTLCARSGLPASACLGAVTALELSGLVECALTGDIRRR